MHTNDKPLQQFYTPSSIMQIFNIATITNHEKKIVLVKGIFRKTNSSSFKGFYYNLLKDEVSDYSINLKTPELLHNQLADNKTIEFSGIITRRIELKSRIEVSITIVELMTQRTNKYSDEELKRFELLNEKMIIGFKDMDGLIRSRIAGNEPVNIKIITGRSGIIDEDIKKALGNSTLLYQLDFHKISLSSTSDIIHALNYGDEKTDIICIARGGGDNLEIFDSPEICGHLRDHKQIIASAIGHAENKTLFEKMADGKFATPSSFGHHLKEIHVKTIAELETNRLLHKESAINTFKNENEKQVLDLKQSMKYLQFESDRKDIAIENAHKRSLADQKQLLIMKKKTEVVFWLMFIVILAIFISVKFFFRLT